MIVVATVVADAAVREKKADVAAMMVVVRPVGFNLHANDDDSDSEWRWLHLHRWRYPCLSPQFRR